MEVERMAGPGGEDRNIQERVGMRIRLLRVSKRMSQGALAKMVGLHRVSVSEIENGRQAPRLGTLDRIARALGVSLGELLGP